MQTETRTLTQEYSSLVTEVSRQPTKSGLVQALVDHSDWTVLGAKTVSRLAHEYGTSILRNALALAEALNIEDGSRGL